MPDFRTLRWLIPLAAVVLAACGTAPQTPPPSQDRSPDSMAAGQRPPREGTWFGDQAARKAAQASETGEPSAEAQPQAAADNPALPPPNGPQVAALPEPDRLPGPQDLTGLDGLQIEALLGSPDFRRRDPPAELWQYSGPGCILDAFLYADGGSTLRVRHVEARSRSVTRVPLADCYRSILADRKKPDGG